MAIKYRLKFQNIDLQNIVIEISSPKWTGAITDIIGVGGESYSKNIKFGDSNPYESHIGITNITARVYSNLIDVDELQLSNDKDWMITVYRNGSIDFKGFLIPDGIQRTRKGAGNAITLQATCGLALLSGKKINITPITDNVYGKITANGQACDNRAPIQYIRAVLGHESMLSNPLPISWSTSVKCDEYPTDDFLAGRLSIFNGIYLKQITEFDNIDCLWLVYNLVKSAKGWMCQRGGKWCIYNLEDIIRFNGVLSVNEITDAVGVQTVAVSNIDFNASLIGKELHDDAMTWYKQAIGVADVSYNHVQQENIIPNGSFDYTTIGATPMDTVPLGWHFSNGLLPPSAPTITDRKGSAVELSFEHGQTGQDDYVFELINPLNIDGNVLYTDMQFGFTMMPMSGFPLSPDLGLIQWNQFPFRISVKYRAVKDGIEKDLYLNEFGFWSDKNLDPNQKIINFSWTGLGAISNTFTVGKSFFTGDRYNGSFKRGGVMEYYSITFTETMDLISGINYLVSKIPNSRIETGSNPTSLIIEGMNGQNPAPMSFFMDKADDYYKYILPEMPQAKLGDAITYQFSTKGNAGRILLPDTGSLYSKDATAGKLSIHFYVKAGQRYILDELWMNTNPNNDRYELTVDEDNSREQFEMGISSSFSGFMLSSYMQNWGNANKTMNFSDYTANGKRLTELYGRGIMHWRSAPRMIYSGSFKVDNFEPYTLFTVGDKKYIPLTYDYNINKGQLTGLIGFEAKLDTPTIVVGHNVKRDGGSVSYGNNSGGDFNGVVNPNWQQVTDVGRTTTWDVTAKGVHNLEIHGIPVIEPSASLMRTDIAYDWFDNNAPSGGGIPPTEWTISGASDANVGSRTNGQLLSWSSSQNKWINVNAPNSAVWGQITGNITSQSDLMSALNGKANTNGSNATGTWPINVSGSSFRWNNQAYQDGNPANASHFMVFSPSSGNWMSATNSEARMFLGMPSGGETLQSVTSRDGYTSNPFGFSNGSSTLRFAGSSGVNYIQSGVDLTNSSADLMFTGMNGTSPIMTLKANTGNVGIGVINPTAKLDVDGAIRAKQDIVINGADGTYRGINFRTNDNMRFLTALDIEVEAGGNVGSNYNIYRYADNGAFLGTAMKIYRSTGLVNFGGAVEATGGNSNQWNTAYTHSQISGNPHGTTWGQLLGKPLIDVNPTPNTIVQRNGSGYIEAVYFRDTNTDRIGFDSGINHIYGGYTDGYLYKYNKQAVNQFLGMPANGDTLQSVTDRGRVTSWDVTAKGTHNLEIHGIPVVEPASGLMRTDIAYDWFDNNAPSGGGIPPTEWTISGASDADVSGRQNGQVLYWDSVTSKWKARDEQSLSGYATQAWVNAQGFATQSWVSGQGYLTSESDTLQSVTNRGNVTSNSITANGLQLRYANGAAYNGIRLSTNEVTTEYWNETTGGNVIMHRFTGGAGRVLAEISNAGILYVTGGDSEQWNTAYTHSQTQGNPHSTQFSQLLNKPTTLAGYGITDGATQASVDGLQVGLINYAVNGAINSVVGYNAVNNATIVGINNGNELRITGGNNGYIYTPNLFQNISISENITISFWVKNNISSSNTFVITLNGNGAIFSQTLIGNQGWTRYVRTGVVSNFTANHLSVLLLENYNSGSFDISIKEISVTIGNIKVDWEPSLSEYLTFGFNNQNNRFSHYTNWNSQGAGTGVLLNSVNSRMEIFTQQNSGGLYFRGGTDSAWGSVGRVWSSLDFDANNKANTSGSNAYGVWNIDIKGTSIGLLNSDGQNYLQWIGYNMSSGLQYVVGIHNNGLSYKFDSDAVANFVRVGASGNWAINASTATALQASRTFWGQSFNGTGNVSGNMTGVGSINADGKITCPVIEPTASIVPTTAPSSPEAGKVYEYFTDNI